VGLRDAAAMAALAAHLIETTPKEQLSAQEASYLLTAGLTGALAKGDQKQASALLETFNKRQNPLRQPPLYLQLLGRQIE
jgi:long-subunit acyl-CoA synthetase (AMP-forming)